MFSAQKIISFFTDAFKKDRESRLYKLIDICAGELELIKETNALIILWRDIDKAQGKVLDLIGGNINQPRGKATDEVYRILLKSKIARNLSDGTIDTIIKVIAIALSANVSEITIREGWETDPNSKPLIELMQLPLSRLLESGMDPVNFVRIVQKTVAGGVKVGTVELAGTFTLGDANAANNMDRERGLGDVNDPSVGGYLGAVYSMDNVPELPI